MNGTIEPNPYRNDVPTDSTLDHKEEQLKRLKLKFDSLKFKEPDAEKQPDACKKRKGQCENQQPPVHV